MRFLVSALALVTSSFMGPAVAADKAKLTVYFVGCATQASLNVYDISRRRDITDSTPMQSGPGNGVQSASIMLPGGYYEVGAGRLPCTATRHIVVLDGMDRDLVLKGGDVLHLTEWPSGIGGSLPSDDLRVAASCESPTGKVEYTAQIIGHAYYFDEIQTPASCVLRVRNTGRDASDLTTSPTVPINLSGRLLILNLSWPTISE